MAKRWVLALATAMVIIGSSGVGFAAFSASDVVHGSATAVSVDLQITREVSGGCTLNSGGAAPGTVEFSDLNAAATEVSLTVANMTLNTYCAAAIVLTNTGPEAVSLTSGILFLGQNGVCGPGQIDCYDVFTLSGIQASGLDCIAGSPTCGYSEEISVNFATLQPGQSFVETIGMTIPAGSDSSTPSSCAFDLVYEANAV